MTNAASKLKHSKTTENRIQRFLWPGTSRPWKERHDVAGPDASGDLWVGEVKEARRLYLTRAYKLLQEAAVQLREAVDGETVGGLFIVIHQVGSSVDLSWVVAGDTFWGPYTLEEFKARWIDPPEAAE